MSVKERRAVNAFLTDEARDGWRTFADAHNVTFSSLLEVLGRRLRAGEMAVIDDVLLGEAQALDVERRRRK